ncbi:acetyltransferase (GNAT) family protein [Stackebrandtia endophytica]|uniref:Acetyltransferase (GNAT) family protein n=2 Tax=Stackebrandtia endophytica TaxID=1496996 RepID=A0A543AYB1_9ACTN|nr:acetyltransferase (GNAT) family protein [Stackebrandtia endophytica]
MAEDGVYARQAVSARYEETMSVEIRGFRPADHAACRDLWIEMVEDRRQMYDDPAVGGDPGAAFEEYLTRLNLSGMWVADDDDTVVGFTGLLVWQRHGEVDPLVVTADRRESGLGSRLLETVSEEARRRRLEYLTIRPPARNLAGMHCAHQAGFTVLAEVTLRQDLTDHERLDGIDLRGLNFQY